MMAVKGSETYTPTYTYDKNNRLTQEKTKVGSTITTTVYTYDGNSNLLQKSNPDGSEQYTYNGLNQLTHTRVGDTVAKYTYNANGIRISKQVGTSTTDYLLDGGDVVAEYTDGEMTAQFVRGVNLIRGILGPAARYFLHNAHGDVVALTTTTGTVRKRYDYDAFGNEKNPSSTDANPFRYCGEYFDKETKTYYLRARYYDPAIGRFTQQDTHWSPANAIYGDNPRKINERQDALGLNTYAYAPEITAIMQSGNLYVYCMSDPVMYCDPTGDFSCISADARTSPIKDTPGLLSALGAALILSVAAIYAANGYIGNEIETQSWLDSKIADGGIDTNNLRNHSVYVIYFKETGDAFYVGRTCDFFARQYAHQKKAGAKYPEDYYVMIPVATNMTLEEARALEELLIYAYVVEVSGRIGLNNTIHSIAYKNWDNFVYEFWRAECLISGLLDEY